MERQLPTILQNWASQTIYVSVQLMLRTRHMVYIMQSTHNKREYNSLVNSVYEKLYATAY